MTADEAVIAAALEEARAGFAVFALAPDSKVPVTDVPSSCSQESSLPTYF